MPQQPLMQLVRIRDWYFTVSRAQCAGKRTRLQQCCRLKAAAPAAAKRLDNTVRWFYNRSSLKTWLISRVSVPQPRPLQTSWLPPVRNQIILWWGAENAGPEKCGTNDVQKWRTKSQYWKMRDCKYRVKISWLKCQPGTCNTLHLHLLSSLKLSCDKQNTPLVTRTTVRR